MADRPADLLLHPVRLRIVQALVGRSLTPGALLETLGDVAQATLYRHLRALETGGLIEVAAERPVRGTVERTYRVVEDAVHLGPADLAGTSRADHFRYFATFVGTLLADYAAFLDGVSDARAPDLEADRVGYRQVPLWLSDEEADELAREMRGLLEQRLQHTPGRGRRRRLVSTVLMPDDRGAAVTRDHGPLSDGGAV
ncbi:helix-turn-helix domain-containing protein [Euzebya tangerina]|uniref:helix-turn-helix domain-containing protein n=1 Tax=Euzebya tangerina TaxID=591198 RepID=UPI000E31FB1F|nr:helix-turn-helix domain-containing protein [Euzebya tangerina]